jgi:thioredoxin-dependent peroxiredoxin
MGSSTGDRASGGKSQRSSAPQERKPAPALAPGDRAPEIRSGAFDLAKLRGKRVVIFFFPKSDTPGCTKEACEFRDSSKKFAKANAEIVGISPDQSEAQQKFAAKYSLPFAFVADSDHSIAEAYGVWKEKSMYGRKYMGIERSTFVVGPDGKVERVFAKVKPEGHAAQVLESLAK